MNIQVAPLSREYSTRTVPEVPPLNHEIFFDSQPLHNSPPLGDVKVKYGSLTVNLPLQSYTEGLPDSVTLTKHFVEIESGTVQVWLPSFEVVCTTLFHVVPESEEKSMFTNEEFKYWLDHRIEYAL